MTTQVGSSMPGDRLAAILGAEPRTPLDVAVRDTLAGLGCLSATVQGASPGGRPLPSGGGRSPA